MDHTQHQSTPAPSASHAGMQMLMSDMAAMETDPRSASMQPTHDLIGAILNHNASGTTVEPPSTPLPMLMTHRGGWMVMLHGNAFLADIQQKASDTPALPASTCSAAGVSCALSRRGGDKLFSTNWIMPMALRRLGPGQFTGRLMLSLEPLTITHRLYPELFQQGETAFGAPIIDGQHPHDFFMEVAALYDIRTSEHTLLSFYAAPVGDPAIGPTAYPHRMSASEDPIAALGHHQQDSTHIAFNVLTAGFAWRGLRVEQSGFHGAEPAESRWHFEPTANGKAIDSYASRITFSPSPNWVGQYSWAHIKEPEVLYPKEDQRRQTASMMYNRAFGPDLGHQITSGNLSATAAWGRTRSLDPDHNTHPQNSYLLEATLKFARTNYVWSRLENAGRSSELLLSPGSTLPPNFAEHPIGHVGAYTFGYDHDLRVAPHLLAAPGAQITTYNPPAALRSIYGDHPFGVVVAVHFRINSN